MLGLKIAVTGALVVLVASCAIRGPWPGIGVGLPLLTAWAGGAAAVVAGLLMAVWA